MWRGLLEVRRELEGLMRGEEEEVRKELAGLSRGELAGSRGLVEVRLDLFIHFSMCPFRTSRLLNFRPQSWQGYEAEIPHSYLW